MNVLSPNDKRLLHKLCNYIPAPAGLGVWFSHCLWLYRFQWGTSPEPHLWRFPDGTAINPYQLGRGFTRFPDGTA